MEEKQKKKKNLVPAKENNSKLNLLLLTYQISSKQGKKKPEVLKFLCFTRKPLKQDDDLSKLLL